MSGRRFAWLLGVALGTLAWPTGIAAADNSPQMLVSATIYKSGGGTAQDSVTLGDLQANPQQCPSYAKPTMTEYRSNGSPEQAGLSPDQPGLEGTWALSTILGCLATPVPISAVTSITVLNQDGVPEGSSNSQITAPDLSSPSDFNDASEGPVISDLGSAIEYNRPWRGGSDHDFNDQITEASGSPVAIEIFAGPALSVTDRASQTSVPAGTTIDFSATVGGLNGGRPSYNWNFDGGAQDSTAARPQVTFSTAGIYDVTLQVTDTAAGAAGSAPDLRITVTGPGAKTSTGGSTQPGGGANPTPTQASGQQSTTPGASTGGGTPHAKQPSTNATPTSTSLHDRGQHRGLHSVSTTSAGTRGSNEANKSSSTASRSPSATSPIASVPAPAPPVTTTRSQPPATPRHRPRAPVATRSPPAPRITSPPPLVSGLLISDLRPLPLGASPLAHSVPASLTPVPVLRRAIRASLLPGLAGALAVILLLSLGAGRELRGRRALRLGS